MARSKKGINLPPDDQDFVLTQIKPAQEPAKQYLLTHRFKTTKFGRVDRRCRAPIASIDHNRVQLAQVRALARLIAVELRKTVLEERT